MAHCYKLCELEFPKDSGIVNRFKRGNCDKSCELDKVDEINKFIKYLENVKAEEQQNRAKE